MTDLFQWGEEKRASDIINDVMLRHHIIDDLIKLFVLNRNYMDIEGLIKRAYAEYNDLTLNELEVALSATVEFLEAMVDASNDNR